MIEGALEINNAKIIDIMTKIDKVKVLSMETRLDSYLVALIR
jgi:Mg2+/Co2+ transporter CorC